MAKNISSLENGFTLTKATLYLKMKKIWLGQYTKVPILSDSYRQWLVILVTCKIQVKNQHIFNNISFYVKIRIFLLKGNKKTSLYHLFLGISLLFTIFSIMKSVHVWTCVWLTELGRSKWLHLLELPNSLEPVFELAIFAFWFWSTTFIYLKTAGSNMQLLMQFR